MSASESATSVRSWEDFETRFLARRRNQRVEASALKPRVYFYVASGGDAIGLEVLFEGSPDAVNFLSQRLKLKNGTIRLVQRDGEAWLQIETSTKETFQAFFDIMRLVAHRIHRDGLGPVEAVDSVYDEFRQVTDQKGILSESEQRGLWGELLILKRLIKDRGQDAVKAWHGHSGDVHDFRLEKTEIEVKTTAAVARVHIIQNLAQLNRSPEHRLFVASLQVAESSNGLTLPALVASIRDILNEAERADFRDRLCSWGVGGRYRDEHAPYYRTAQILRTPILVVPVDDQVPALTESLFQGHFPSGVAARIQDVQYRIKLDGLGVLESEKAFGELSLWPQRKDCDA